MIAKNCTIRDLEAALKLTNDKYDNNITWNNGPYYTTNTAIRFTLKCKSSKGPGSKRGFNWRHLISACWHVHGDFFDNLFKINKNTIIISLNKPITKEQGNWEDFNTGSICNPRYASEACECY